MTVATSGTGTAGRRRGVVANGLEIVLYALLAFASLSPNVLTAIASRTALALVVVLAAAFVLLVASRRTDGSATGLAGCVAAVTVAFLYVATGIGTMSVRSALGRPFVPAVFLSVVVGLAWLLPIRSHRAGERAWRLALVISAAMILAWIAATTALLAPEQLVAPRVNGAIAARLIALLFLAGGVAALVRDDRHRARRVTAGVLLALVVGLLRAAV